MSEPVSPSDSQSDSTLISQHDEIKSFVVEEFDVEEDLVEHGVSTFYVRLKPKSKRAFVRLVRKLKSIGFIPMLRERDGRNVLKVAPKPKIKPSRSMINLILLLATIVTVYVTGYMFSLDLVDYGLNPWVGGAAFALALLGILGTHGGNDVLVVVVVQMTRPIAMMVIQTYIQEHLSSVTASTMTATDR